MSKLAELANEIEALAEKATPVPWEMDAGGTYRRDEAQVVMLGGPDAKPQRLFDTLNSDVAEIGHDGDEDGTYYFDCQGRDNFKLIEILVNNLPAILSALREGERLRGALDDIEDCMEVRLHGATVGNEAERPLATSCWGQALRDTQRIKAAALSSAKEPGHDA